ncbi:MAG: hypothetical protein ACI9FB_000236 [Candidatus Azotimanducaceae bacterium]|jgi:hypothetical protein
MKSNIMGVVVLLASLITGFSQSAEGRDPPVAKLVQVSGVVEYSRNGKDWRPVRRTKYLFSGYQIKTGADGGGKLINQQSGMAQSLGANSEIAVSDTDIALVSGTLSKPVEESSSIFQGLSNKFAKAQRYTTVRRSVTKPGGEACDSKVRTIRNVTLSSSYPDLVWRNACPEYSYNLFINGESHAIAANANAEMIRFPVVGAKAGEHTYRVEVMDNDGTVYIPKKDSTFTWLDGKAEKEIMADLSKVEDDAFLASDVLESQNMYVAAMDMYRSYFVENPDDNDMRPLLIKAYQELKLSDLRANEARLYTASLEEDF